MRAINRIMGVLLGVILLAVGLAVAVQAVAFLVNRPNAVFPVRQWSDTAARTAVGDPIVLAVSVIMVIVGLLIALAQFTPVPPARLRAGSMSTSDEWWLPRRSVQRRAAAAAVRVHGVVSARADVTGRPDRWRLNLRADVTGRDPAMAQQTEHDVADAVQHELARLGATTVPVTVRVHRTGGVR
jgi:hypothetical protein